MITHHSQYSILKKKIFEEAGHFFSLEQIKDHFAPVINSKRALSKVKSLLDIMRLLEERAVLNFRNVACLEKIGELLENNNIKNLVHCYTKLYLDGIEEELCICGVRKSTQLHFNEMYPQLDNQYLLQNENHIIPVSDLIEALKNVSQRIGKAWPYLARELGIEEGHIDRIRFAYPKNYEQAAQAAFRLWLKREKENASIERLDTALNARHCVRHGLGSFLREPGIVPMDVDCTFLLGMDKVCYK